MTVILDTSASSSPKDIRANSPAVVPVRVTNRPSAPSASEEPTIETQKTSAISEAPQANLTFRRDDKGQIYYVLTDPRSGKEIREVPPAEIRKVGEGIADFLKEEAAKAVPQVDRKA